MFILSLLKSRNLTFLESYALAVSSYLVESRELTMTARIHAGDYNNHLLLLHHPDKP